MNEQIKFICNREYISTDLHPGTTLLDFLRKHQQLVGTKEGCREGDCGACTVLIGEFNNDELKYKTVNSCLMPLGDVNGKHVVSIEGLNNTSLSLSPIQQAFVTEGGTQCGFCTPGFIVSLTGYFLTHETINNTGAFEYLEGNICRCTGHVAVRRAVDRVTKDLPQKLSMKNEQLKSLVQNNILPEYFLEVPARLKVLNGEILVQQKNAIKYDIVVAGGTDLYVHGWEDILNKKINFISNEKKEEPVTFGDNCCKISSTAAISDLGKSPLLNKYFKEFAKSLKFFGSVPIRNRATVGGNILNASPIGDITIILLSLDAKLIFSGNSKTREIKLKDFYKGYKNYDLHKGEILVAASFNLPKKQFHFNYEKISRRTYLDIASVNSAFYLETTNNVIEKLHISAGGVAPIPLYLNETVKFLTGKSVTSEILNNAAAVMQTEIFPISDARGSAEYKRLLLRQLLYAHFMKFFPRLIKLEEVI